MICKRFAGGFNYLRSHIEHGTSIAIEISSVQVNAFRLLARSGTSTEWENETTFGQLGGGGFASLSSFLAMQNLRYQSFDSRNGQSGSHGIVWTCSQAIKNIMVEINGLSLQVSASQLAIHLTPCIWGSSWANCAAGDDEDSWPRQSIHWLVSKWDVQVLQHPCA